MNNSERCSASMSFILKKNSLTFMIIVEHDEIHFHSFCHRDQHCFAITNQKASRPWSIGDRSASVATTNAER